MKHSPFAVFISITGTIATTARPFVNLDFEAGSTNTSQVETRTMFSSIGELKNYVYGTGPVDQLMPDWQITLNQVPTNMVAVGNGHFGSPGLFPMPTHASLAPAGDYYNYTLVPDGKYALLMDNTRRSGIESDPGPVFVSQTAEVPPDAEWLSFRAFRWQLSLEFGVRINQESYDNSFNSELFIADSAESNRFMFDISRHAGKETTIGFFIPGDGITIIDSISFVVPEPSVSSLALAGGAALLALGSRRKS